jgi:hypothetical protein
MKPISAVDWLFEQLCSEKLSWNKDSNGTIFFDKITSDILQQAKQMEKDQMRNSSCPYVGGWEDDEFEYWYNETFKLE